MDRRYLLLLPLLALIGCGNRASKPYVSWIQPLPPAEDLGSNSAYDGYCKAAEQAEISAGKLGDRTKITPGTRKAILAKLAPSMSALESASRKDVLGYRFVPGDPSQANIHCKGWTLLGQAMVWRIEDQVTNGQIDAAIGTSLSSSKFAFDLLGGSAMEASLGLALVDDIRKSIIPAVPKMDSKQLGRLSSGLTALIERHPKITTTLENERQNMLAGVQYVQDCFTKDELTKLSKDLGPSVNKGIEYLKGLKSKGDDERLAYFQGFADEGNEIAKFWIEQANLPADKRRIEDGEPKIDFATTRPWKKLSNHFFGAPEPLLAEYDATIARTKLLALETSVERAVKIQGYAPQDINKFGTISVDPFTGNKFAYHREGKQFKLYSVGTDFKDDGGQTDDSFRSPDLTIEKSS